MASDLHCLEILCHNVENGALGSSADSIPQPHGGYQDTLPIDQGVEAWLIDDDYHCYTYR
jgi:hypothetical protein